MNNEMPEEIYVFPDSDGDKDDFWAKPVAPEYDYGFKDQTRYIRVDKAAPVERIIQIARLPEAVEFRREVAEFAIDRVKNFYGMNKDRPELSLDAILWIAACEYLKLQQGGE